MEASDGTLTEFTALSVVDETFELLDGYLTKLVCELMKSSELALTYGLNPMQVLGRISIWAEKGSEKYS